MLDHISYPVSNYERSKAFYMKALGPLGYGIILEVQHDGAKASCGFGADGHPSFWISKGATATGQVHVAFKARTRKAVEEFYEAALKAGGKDNGMPGLRPHYHDNYYGAFVLDPDGHNIEAVCHLPK